MAKQVTINDSKSFIPSGYTGLTNLTTSTDYPITNGYTDTTSTTYARFTLSTSTTGYLYYTFNVTGIPSNATITSITGQVKARVSNTSRVTNTVCQLYAGTTAKGSNVTFASTSTSNVVTLSPGTSWNVSELSDLRLRIGGTGSSNTQTKYIYFYGASITINYSVSGTAYEITAISNTDLVQSIDPEGTTDVMSGDSYTLNVYADTFGDFIVEDNGTDVTNQLVQKENPDTVDTISAVASSNFETGFSSSDASFYMSSSSQGTTNLQMPIGYTAENPNTATDQGNGYTYVKDNNNNTATGWIIYGFDFSSIPTNATIVSVSVKVYGCRESSTTDSTHVAKIGLYSGTVLKGSEQEFSSTSNTMMTISNAGTWTREELQNAKLRFTVAYYGGRIKGITWSVTYSIPATTQYYWEYTLSNVSADHTIYVTEAVVIPPDEDPTKEYYPITISSINAITTPGRGTTRVENGTSETITITPSDPQLTLALDNGVDITPQLVYHGGQQPTYTVAQAPNASYGFVLNANNFYESNNKGQSQTVAVARISFSLPRASLVTLKYINYAEETYDYGMFGNIDVALDTVNHEEGANGINNATNLRVLLSTSEDNSPDEKTLTYEVPAGNHFIEAKFSKDQYTDNYNDSLQFKVDSIQELTPSNYYTYDLTNISQEHSLIFIFGDVTYYFVNSSTNSDCTLYPNGQMVQLPGDSYRLTIVPKNNTDTITLRDNNVDVTNQIERKEVTTEKDGQTITVVNYIYRLSDIQATHDLVVSSALQNLSSSIYLNSQWNEGEIKRKQDSRWGTLSYTRIWVHNGTAWVENAQRTITTNGMIFGGVINNGGGE